MSEKDELWNDVRADIGDLNPDALAATELLRIRKELEKQNEQLSQIARSLLRIGNVLARE